MGWETIDTAPKDGTPFIGAKLFNGGLTAMAIVSKDENLLDKMWRCCISIQELSEGNVHPEFSDKILPFLTHWMPLPEPPK